MDLQTVEGWAAGGSMLPKGWREEIALTLESIPSENGMGQHYTRLDSPIVQAITGIAIARGARSSLELGCGRGACSQVLARAGVSLVVATDINAKGIDELNSIAAVEGLTLRGELFDASSVDCPPEYQARFDVVIAKDVYPFMTPEQINRFIANASQALRPGGVFIFTAPSIDSRLYRESVPRDGSEYFRTLSDDQKQFIQCSLDHFTFSTEERLAVETAACGMTLLHTERYGREGGWILAAAAKEPCR